MAGYTVLVGAVLTAQTATGESTTLPQQMAIAELKRLGAKVAFRSETATNGEKQQVLHVIVDQENWKGGDDGLSQIEQLPRRTKLFIVGRRAVSEERLTKLKKAVPDLEVIRRSHARLGISFDATKAVDGCLIVEVQGDSPAEKAGLTRGDLIKRLDGKAIKGSEDLVAELCLKDPDDQVEIVVLRNDMSITIKAKLERW